ncbi:MAG TPA: hypothetical protein PLK14_13220 [Sediminibacterium sp.]|jgi:hypothetical protein|nr:hypothetical protein [Sediminibacterium sp.]HQS56067.1 hypothetical protein [Sediminibacterium sp.]
MANAIAISLFIGLALVIIILLFLRNKKDEKLINPDAEDAVDELMMNQQRRKDKI